jgi:serine/threonine-protein kinase
MEFVHRHAVQIRHFAVTREGIRYMTMDYSAGESLLSLIRREGSLPPRRAARIMRQVLEAVAEAHRKKIIHRDLKPDNVLVERDGDADFVKVLDFGLAKAADGGAGGADLTIGEGTDRVVGTPAYMSPEQACGEDADHRADLYSCGVILYEMLMGRPPFESETPQGYLGQHMAVMPQPMRVFDPKVPAPAEVDAVVLRALAKDPKDRWQTADEFSQALQDAARSPSSGRRRRGSARAATRGRSSPTSRSTRSRSRRSARGAASRARTRSRTAAAPRSRASRATSTGSRRPRSGTSSTRARTSTTARTRRCATSWSTTTTSRRGS